MGLFIALRFHFFTKIIFLGRRTELLKRGVSGTTWRTSTLGMGLQGVFLRATRAIFRIFSKVYTLG